MSEYRRRSILYRHVVKEIPPHALPIRPSEGRPGDDFTESYNYPATEDEPAGTGTRVVSRRWKMDSDTARILGEAKSLPKGCSLRVANSISLLHRPHWVAWFAENLGLHILSVGSDFLITQGKNFLVTKGKIR